MLYYRRPSSLNDPFDCRWSLTLDGFHLPKEAIGRDAENVAYGDQGMDERSDNSFALFCLAKERDNVLMPSSGTSSASARKARPAAGSSKRCSRSSKPAAKAVKRFRIPRRSHPSPPRTPRRTNAITWRVNDYGEKCGRQNVLCSMMSCA
jgi:hypothetical protein